MGALRNELYHSLSLIYKFHAVAVAHHLPFTTFRLQTPVRVWIRMT